jgi:predicted HicB family RNase H-like nuclease
MSIFQYKGFVGSIEVDSEDKCLHGKLLYINDLVTYEATSIIKLESISFTLYDILTRP